MLTKYHRLPKTITLDGVNYTLDWDSNGNMDGWVATINIGRKLSDKQDDEGFSELLNFEVRNSIYSPCCIKAYTDGEVVCTVRI